MISLMQGDCLERMKEILDGSVDMVLADIPYGVVNRDSNGLRKLNKGNADVDSFRLNSVMAQIARVCRGSVYIFCGTEQVSDLRALMVSEGMTTRLCIWEKTNPSPMNGQHVWLSGVECCVYGKFRGATFNEHCKNTVWRHPVPRGKLHPTMKPIPLMERLIEASSKPGDTVLDFTAGSFTTGVACVNIDRKFIGIEIDKGYFDVGVKRVKEAMNWPHSKTELVIDTGDW